MTILINQFMTTLIARDTKRPYAYTKNKDIIVDLTAPSNRLSGVDVLNEKHISESKNIIINGDGLILSDNIIDILDTYVVKHINKKSCIVFQNIDVNFIRFRELINYIYSLSKNFPITFKFDSSCKMNISESLFKAFAKKLPNHKIESEVKFLVPNNHIVDDIEINTNTASIIISPQNNQTINLINVNFKNINNIEITSAQTLNSLLNLLTYITDYDVSHVSLIFTNMHFKRNEFIEMLKYCKLIYKKITLHLSNCSFLHDDGIRVTPITPTNTEIMPMIHSYYNKKDVEVHINSNSRNIKMGNITMGGDMNQMLNDMLEALGGIDFAGQGAAPGSVPGAVPFYDGPAGQRANITNSNIPILLRITPEDKLSGLQEMVNSGQLDDKVSNIYKEFLANNKIKSQRSSSSADSHANDKDMHKLNTFINLPHGHGSILKYFKHLPTNKQSSTINKIKAKTTTVLKNIFEIINLKAQPDVTNAVINSYLNIMFSEFVSARSKKILLCGTPGNGKTTALITQGWFILFRDILVYHMSKYSKQQLDIEKYEAKIMTLCDSIFAEIQHLIYLGIKIHSDPNYFCAFYIARIPCQNIQEVLDMQGTNSSYVGANPGTFMRTYSGVGSSNFHSLYNIITPSSNIFPLSSAMLSDTSYILSGRAVIFDEVDKFPAKNGNKDATANTLTIMLEEGKLENTFLELSLSFSGAPIGCTANKEDLIPTHIKDRASMIPPGNWSNPTRAEIFKIKSNQVLNTANYTVSLNDNNKYTISISDKNLVSRVVLDNSVINSLSSLRVEVNKGSLRKLTDNVTELGNACIQKLNTMNDNEILRVNNEVLMSLCPNITLDREAKIIYDINKSNSMLMILSSQDKSELKDVQVKVALNRFEAQRDEQQIIANFYSEQQKDYNAIPSMLSLMKASLDAWGDKLKTTTLTSAADDSMWPISKSSLTSAIGSITQHFRRLVISIGTLSDSFSNQGTDNVCLGIILILLAQNCQFTIPVNLFIVGLCDILGNIVFNPKEDNNIASKLAALQASIQQESLHVLVPIAELGEDINGYIYNNFNNISASVYKCNNLLDMVLITYSLYIDNLSTKGTAASNTAITEAQKNAAKAIIAKYKIDHKAIIDKMNIVKGVNQSNIDNKQSW